MRLLGKTGCAPVALVMVGLLTALLTLTGCDTVDSPVAPCGNWYNPCHYVNDSPQQRSTPVSPTRPRGTLVTPPKRPATPAKTTRK